MPFSSSPHPHPPQVVFYMLPHLRVIFHVLQPLGHLSSLIWTLFCHSLTLVSLSGVLQGLVLGWMLLNIFVSDMERGIECTLNKFADDTKTCGTVSTMEGNVAIQRDPENLERWFGV